jgi:hypothetical protein
MTGRILRWALARLAHYTPMSDATYAAILQAIEEQAP